MGSLVPQRLEFLPALVAAFRAGNAPVVVTGAGGWLGQALLEMFSAAFADSFARRVTAFAAAARPIRLPSGPVVAARAYRELATWNTAPAFIFHAAFRTKGHAHEPDYIDTNRRITSAMRDFIHRNGAAGLFIPSSGAAYGPADLAANPYGVLKREDENSFGALAAKLGFPAAIIRIFNLAGPCINNLSGYALACIIADVQRGGPIDLRAAHPVFRSYTHVGDVLNIAAAIMLGGLELGVFDTAGAEALEIGDLAARVSLVLTGKQSAIIRPAGWLAGAPDRYLGNFPAYQAAAAQAGVRLQSLDQQIIDTAAYMAGLK